MGSVEAYPAGQRVVISSYANFQPAERAVDTLIELRVKQVVGIVRHGSKYVTMVDFPEHSGLNIATVQLEPAPAQAADAGEAVAKARSAYEAANACVNNGICDMTPKEWEAAIVARDRAAGQYIAALGAERDAVNTLLLRLYQLWESGDLVAYSGTGLMEGIHALKMYLEAKGLIND